jgi:hypothetical protein
MTNLNFPSNPELGQVYKSSKGQLYWWDGVKWAVKQPVAVEPTPEPVVEPTPEPVVDETPVVFVSEFMATLDDGSIDFPPSPTVGYEFVASNGITYVWDGVKWVINQNVVVDNDNNNGDAAYVLPIATNARLGGVRIGTGIINQNGTISIDTGGSLKGDKGDTGSKGDKGDAGDQGDKGDAGDQGEPGVSVESASVDLSGHLIITKTDASTIDAGSVIGPKGDTGDKGDKGDAADTASSQTAGIVKIGSNINIATDGTISVPVATSSALGVVKPGSNVNIDANGAISVSKGAGINTVVDIPDVNSTVGGAVLNDGALLIYNASSERWDTIRNLRSDEMDGGFF